MTKIVLGADRILKLFFLVKTYKKTEMCIICTGEYKGETAINCSDCPSLKEIPVIKGVRELLCRNCPSLTKISVIEGLQELECYNCPFLTKIPVIQELQGLYVSNCPLLVTITRTRTMAYTRCKWLERTPEMVRSLVVLQKRYRKKKFKRIIEYRIALKPHFYRDLIGVAICYA